MAIIQLPEELANKIAAGEVVERPASVVKELIENSVDANSSWIKIELKQAGLELIKITDNGDGMSEKDSEKAFLRHATSKILEESDLFHIRTLGFRGEALASIASVSRLSLKTSKGDSAGIELTLEGGKLIAKRKSDARKGTEIRVADLFYNTPARLKYVKSLHTELGHITDIINRIAFSHPEIRFDVSHEGRPLFKTPGSGDLLQVISQVYSVDLAKSMLAIENESLDFKLRGYICKPEITRATRSYMTTIINGRYIRHHGLNHAILRGYHTLLSIRRFPIVVLQIEMDPVLVDANVHPTKLEVRFSKEKELMELIEETIRESLYRNTLIPEIQKEKRRPREKEHVHRQMDLTNLSFDQETKNNVYTEEIIHEKGTGALGQAEIEQEKVFDGEGNMQVSEKAGEENDQRLPALYPVGQVQGTYIVAQNEEGMYLIDQHAAQERIKYEYFKTQFGQVNNQVQELLLPINFDFSRQESLIIEQNIKKLQEVGVELESFGSQSYIVRSHPTWFPKGFEEESIRDIINQVIERDRIDIEHLREEAAILMACKRSIKANHPLSLKEMAYLLEDLRKTNNPFTCPHGRPVIIHFSSYELEKMFKRVM